MVQCMLERVRETIATHGLLVPGDRVVVAVSGGADSVALLDMLSRLDELCLSLIVAHLDHALRGEESAGDAEFVRNLAERYGLTFETTLVDVKAHARAEGLSLEDAGRRARYAFFSRVAERHGARVTVLAHHADDQAETLLLRLFRGSGLTGLCGMTPSAHRGKIVRPLLAVTRAEIEEYLRERGLDYRNDSSNSDRRFARNRIRLDLLPQLKEYNPSIVRRLAETAALLAADEELVKHVTDAEFRRLSVTTPVTVSFSVAGIKDLVPALRMRLYRRALTEVRGDLCRIASCHLAQIDALLVSSRPNCRVRLPGGAAVLRRYDSLVFEGKWEPVDAVGSGLVISGPGIYPLPGGGELAVSLTAPPSDWRSLPTTVAYFNSEDAPFPWHVRCFCHGDRISPFGLKGSKKVKKLFIDRKISAEMRRKVPLVFSGDRLIWIGGICRGDSARISDSGRVAIRTEIHGLFS